MHYLPWVGEAQYEMSEFLQYRKSNPALLYGTQVMAIMNAYSYMPVEAWAKADAQAERGDEGKG